MAVTAGGTPYVESSDLVANYPGASLALANRVDQVMQAPTQNAQTGTTYTAALLDAGKTVTLSNASAVTLTIPAQATVAWVANTQLNFLNIGAGTVTITPAATVTINGTTLTLTTSQGGSLVRTASNTWTFIQTAGGYNSSVFLNTVNGYGSTNNKIRRFTNIVRNSGADITYADSATLGSSFTINTTGMYSISCTDNFTAGNWLGLSLNSTQLSTPIYNITTAHILSAASTVTANGSSSVSFTGFLTATNVVRPHGDGNPTGTLPQATQFSIGRVG